MITINTSAFTDIKAELFCLLARSINSGEHEIHDYVDLIHEHVEACLPTLNIVIYSCLFDSEFDCVLEQKPEHTLNLADIILVAIYEQLHDCAYDYCESLIEDYNDKKGEEA